MIAAIFRTADTFHIKDFQKEARTLTSLQDHLSCTTNIEIKAHKQRSSASQVFPFYFPTS